MVTKIKVSWRQTTTDRFKCVHCRVELKGKKGFIHYTVYGYYQEEFRLCQKCYKKANIVKEFSEKEKEARYNLLIKKRILNKLK